VMTIATFMILDQLQIAENIVTITYAGLIFAIALGSALAFGLGGREVARDLLQGAYDKGREHKDELRRDLDQGITRAKEEAGSVRESTSSPTSDRDRDVTRPVGTTAAAAPAMLEPAHELGQQRNHADGN
jgi:hypothetical protein